MPPIDADCPPVPASVVRLSTSLHRQAPSKILEAASLNYSLSFKSTGAHHPSTAALLKQADLKRVNLATALSGRDYDAVQRAAEEYLPVLKQIIVSCEVQPEGAVLDKKLIFKWVGGLEDANITDGLGRSSEGEKRESSTTHFQQQSNHSLSLPLSLSISLSLFAH